MSDFTPSAPAPDAAPTVDAAPATTVTPEAAPAAEQPLHPSWARTFDEAGIPDMLRPKLIEQVRRTEASYNQGIEKARGEAVPSEWRDFLDQAQQANANPDELITSWNAAQAIRSDPIAFLDSFSAQVDKAVSAGLLTRADGQQAKAQALDAVDSDTITLGSPEATEIAQLREQINAITGAQEQKDQAAAAAASAAEAEQYATEFISALSTSLATAGFVDGAGTVSPQTIQAVGNIADSLLASDQTGKLTVEAAISAAVQQALMLSGRTAPAAAPVIPVHGGGAGLPAARAPKFASEKEREAAMLEVGRNFGR